jgi:predicted metal-dependent phosphoesterase TrpH
VIDLHTHTTASDGRDAPAALVAKAAAAGVTVLAVTDHDTVAGCAAAAAACAARGIAFVNGIEITAMREGGDIHVLGYFVDRDSETLRTFLDQQRQRRVDRIREIVVKLAAHGIHLDADAIVRPAVDDRSKAAGRPWVARALIDAGVVDDTNQAFDQWLSRGRPGYVPREAASPAEVFARIHAAGGIASLAHPVLVGHDEWLDAFAREGLDALEAYHSDHDAGTTAHYLRLAARLGLAVTGGSDYHGDPAHGPTSPGDVSLPKADFDRLVILTTEAQRHRESGSTGGPA